MAHILVRGSTKDGIIRMWDVEYVELDHIVDLSEFGSKDYREVDDLLDVYCIMAEIIDSMFSRGNCVWWYQYQVPY